MTQDPSLTLSRQPDADEAWCAARAADVAAYLQRTALPHGRVGEWPAWHVMPYASIWAIESKDRPEWIGWWVLCGDLPTDGLPAQGIDTPRDAMRAFGKRWTAHADALDHGEVPPAWRHLGDDALPKLTAQLRTRGTALTTWAADDSAWPAAEPTDPATEPDADD
jgi:hypothetical protein